VRTIHRGEFLVWALQHGDDVELYLIVLSEYIQLPVHFLVEVLLSLVCSNCIADNVYSITLKSTAFRSHTTFYCGENLTELDSTFRNASRK